MALTFSIFDGNHTEIKPDFPFAECWHTLYDAIADIQYFNDFSQAPLDDPSVVSDEDIDSLKDWQEIWLSDDDDINGAWTIVRYGEAFFVKDSGWRDEFRQYFTREGYEALAEDNDLELLEQALKLKKAEDASGLSEYPTTLHSCWLTLKECFGAELDDLIASWYYLALGYLLKLAHFAYQQGKKDQG